MRLDEINSHGEQAYFAAVAENLGRLLGYPMKLVGVDTAEYSRTIRIEGREGDQVFIFAIRHSWKNDGSPTKPVTRISIEDPEGFSNGSISLGRFAFWRDDPAGYAEDLSRVRGITEAISELLG